MDRARASQLRQRLRQLWEERGRLEASLLRPPGLIRGSLRERYLPAGAKRRATPAYYLVVRARGRALRSCYVRREHWEAVRAGTDAYRQFQQTLTRLRGLGTEIVQALGELRRLHEVAPP